LYPDAPKPPVVVGYEIAGYVDRSVEHGPARVLDVACGTGTLARRLAEAGHVVTGIDTVPGLVEAARRRTPPALADRLAFTARDVALAGPPGVLAYDVVVALHTIYWHPYPERLLRACWAALRPGGHAIVVEGLTRVFRRQTAVDHVSFRVARGRFFGFLGPNGAGKTTTMRILSCFMPYSYSRSQE